MVELLVPWCPRLSLLCHSLSCNVRRSGGWVGAVPSIEEWRVRVGGCLCWTDKMRMWGKGTCVCGGGGEVGGRGRGPPCCLGCMPNAVVLDFVCGAVSHCGCAQVPADRVAPRSVCPLQPTLAHCVCVWEGGAPCRSCAALAPAHKGAEH